MKIEKMVTWEKGKELVVVSPSKVRIGSILFQMLHELCVQIREVFGQENVDSIKQFDKVVELTFDKPENITLEPPAEYKKRAHASTQATSGRPQLLNVKKALFIIEDRQNRGLDAHVLVGSEFNNIIYYTCWTGKQEWKKKLIKNVKPVF